jgi:hypothetical protein
MRTRRIVGVGLLVLATVIGVYYLQNPRPNIALTGIGGISLFAGLVLLGFGPDRRR